MMSEWETLWYTSMVPADDPFCHSTTQILKKYLIIKDNCISQKKIKIIHVYVTENEKIARLAMHFLDT